MAEAGTAAPRMPEELDMLTSVTVLPPEPLPGGSYPVHGNVTAELAEFAPMAAGLIEASTVASPSGPLRLVQDRGLESSCWDA